MAASLHRCLGLCAPRPRGPARGAGGDRDAAGTRDRPPQGAGDPRHTARARDAKSGLPGHLQTSTRVQMFCKPAEKDLSKTWSKPHACKRLALAVRLTLTPPCSLNEERATGGTALPQLSCSFVRA